MAESSVLGALRAPIQNLPKHAKYRDLYKPNDTFWGIGIEEETYMEATKPLWVARPIALEHHKPERYSVDYYKNSYQPTFVVDMARLLKDPFHQMPFVWNAHAFTKTDVNGHHVTTYEKKPKPNSLFKGVTFLQELQLWDPYFLNPDDAHWIFDGDTIEFATVGFYKARVPALVKELTSLKSAFLGRVNRFCAEKGYHRSKKGGTDTFRWPTRNPPFAVYWTNPQNVVMFNNGTYHLNFTVPTRLGGLGADGLPVVEDPVQFLYKHRKIIRLFQWIEPLLLAVYGTPDPLSAVSDRYSAASQRCAMSRYIGIGTYDTTLMPEGKIVTTPIGEIRGSETPYWWYKQFHASSGYKSLEKIGLDINFRKHAHHGIELRIFDWFPEEKLPEVLTFLVNVMDIALLRPEVPEAILDPSWNGLVVRVLRQGPTALLPVELLAFYAQYLEVPVYPSTLFVRDFFRKVRKVLKARGKERLCAKCML